LRLEVVTVGKVGKGKGKGRFAGPIEHCSLKANCTLAPEIVPSFISRGALHQGAREACTSEGRKLNTRILPEGVGFFTCPKFDTWGRLFNYPSEGSHAEDFEPANSGIRSQHANH
jgi:hypothetical protein